MKTLSFIAFPTVLAVSGFCIVIVWLNFVQRKMQYFPTHDDAKGLGGGAFKPLRNDSGEFMGYFRPHEKPERIIVFFHGNAGEALHREWLNQFIPNKQTLLVLAEYPGYGAKPGHLSEASIFQDAEALLDLIQRRWNVPVTVMGESLGSGVASYVVSTRRVDRLALISPFSSALDVARFWYPYLPVRQIMKDKYLSIDHLRKVTIPLHIVHGSSDELIPLALAKKLFEAYPGHSKHFTELGGVGHNNIVDALLHSTLGLPFREFIIGKGN